MLVIGIVVFTFPVLFSYLQSNTLSSFVVVYLYMGGIVTMLTNVIPNLVRVIVSYKRINTFIEELSAIDENRAEKNVDAEKFDLKLDNVTFCYNSEGTAPNEDFVLGPVNCEFNSGEIVFISGGNGSGKTTLAKLLTGLYIPDSGTITVNGEKADPKLLGRYYSAVYSDFYLFDKIYGINTAEKKDEIEKFLKILRLDKKVAIENNRFSTLRLSTGQRKRLALLLAYLEDKPVYFFDEWAADQDPEFRKIFYTELLPQLKNRGKAVIAITHDDRYFGVADKLLKMESGKISGETVCEKVN
jgi:putative ATP-binding cassette transporter